MIYWLLSLFVSSSLFALSPATSAAAISGIATAVFPIDPMQRGKDIANMVTTFLASPYLTSLSEVAIQTARNGLITDVQGINPAPNYTLLIVKYFSAGDISQYVVVPVEQILEVIYSTTTISGSFGVAVTTGVLPVFEVDLLERANDIVSVVSDLNSKTGIYYGPRSQVGIQTTLTGTYYVPLTNGMISNVQSVSLNSSAYGTLLLITYKQTNGLLAYISVGTDQIYGINYYSYVPPPPPSLRNLQIQ